MTVDGAPTAEATTRIPLVDVAWQHSEVRSEIERALGWLLEDRTCDGGDMVRALEADVATYLGGGVHTIGVQSGLAAEFLILKAMGIGPGDEVITVPNSDIATTAAISHTGARFVLVDVDAASHNMDPARLESAITPRTRAIVPVHMYGLPARMDDVGAIARRHGLPVVEDATLALGARLRDVPVGTLGEAAFFSFAPRKVIGGTGNGGMIVTRNSDLAWRLRLLRGYGHDPARGEAPVSQRHLFQDAGYLAEGYNRKLDPLQAAIVRAKLAHLDEWAGLRQRVADRYTAALAALEGVSPPHVPTGWRHAWRNYVVTLRHRDRVRAHLLRRGITASLLYVPPVYLTPTYADLGLGPGSYPVAESLAETLLCLPMYPGLTDAQADAVISGITEALRGDAPPPDVPPPATSR